MTETVQQEVPSTATSGIRLAPSGVEDVGVAQKRAPRLALLFEWQVEATASGAAGAHSMFEARLHLSGRPYSADGACS